MHECTCSNSMVSRYQPNPLGVRRISGPLLDRADPRSRIGQLPHRGAPGRGRLCESGERLSGDRLSDERLGELSEAIRERVEAARQRQRRRFEGTGLMSNADALAAAGVGPAEVQDHCRVDDACTRLKHRLARGC